MRLVVFRAVEAGGEDGLHRSVAEGADVERAAAGGLHALVGIGAGQPHEAEAAAVALFGVGAAFEEPLDEGGGVGSDPSAPGDEPGRAPVGVAAVRGGHVGRIGGVDALPVAADVDRDAPVPVEDLDRCGGDPDIDLAAGQGVGDAVEAAAGLHVVVDVDSGPAPLGELVAPGGQGPRRRTVQILEPAQAAALGLPERALVERGHERRDGVSEFAEREERLVAQRRHDPALDVLDGGLRLRLVPGLPRPRREHGRPVVGRSGWRVPGTRGSDPARSGLPRGPPPSRCPGSRVRAPRRRTRTCGRARPSSRAATGSASHPRTCSSRPPARRRRPPRPAPRRCARPRPRTSGPRSPRTPSRPPGTPGAAPRPAAPATAGSGRRSGCTRSRPDAPSGTPATTV